ncbi:MULTISPECIES: glycerophosphodiester phosphodiesterase [Thermomonospora]|uniref:glycerophosphodiester phosphodiesterase n=1 Tax=Thermomonospora curvata (strain ATCC 19995 / DSM 43183 / JCM 3096 / KCTC 9072 / NBRC 15933 / NCIMB 10081 / Henssen B9) TaxID=471852 RepID=D1AEG6_THECD|nr:MULTISPECIES: glycerophosphodiester phosphodiesterase [Thermomonospora]ACY95782.1 glycerophosphoryl diester phosphodiesterase [Thermomonospora curvata DSM 43183]PKK16354.1 MAG: glycerophosphodiester phosphodiesterase [Thermomonospora sp. CIF 1]
MSRITRILAGGLVAAAVAGFCTVVLDEPAPAAAERAGRPIVIGHRGASGLRPEHTLAAYRMAIAQGADYIEPDLVMTKDRRLVARHDNWLADSTDVEEHPEFADRKRTKTVDGVTRTDWFTEDFTLAELRTLRAEERIPGLRPGNTVFNGLEPIPTLEEVLDLARKHGVGVYPETKHPSYFDSLGLSMEEPLVAALHKYGFDSRRDKVFIQSFETSNLRDLRKLTKVRLIQLIDGSGAPYDLVRKGDRRTYADLVKPAGLKWISSYADGIGPATGWIVPVDSSGRLGKPTTLVRDAHRHGLAVHTWTVRNENEFLPADFRQGNAAAPGYRAATGDVGGWLSKLYRLGVDGVFCDDPSAGVGARTAVFGS